MRSRPLTITSSRFGPDPFVDMMAANALERLGDLEAARDRYDRAANPLMQGPIEAGSAGGYGLAALLAAGNFHTGTASASGRCRCGNEGWN